MKKLPLSIAISSILVSSSVVAQSKVFDEASLIEAISEANSNPQIHQIVFKKNALIELSAPVIYTGSQAIRFKGNNATIDGSHAGNFTLDADLTAVTTDGTLIFNTANNVTLSKLNVVNSATRGIVVNIPQDSKGDDIRVTLNKVTVKNSALYGVHIDDNANEFDDGNVGSDIGIDLNIRHSTFIANGTGAIDFDGVRVDERGEGDIEAHIFNTHIDGNGGDGMELDEAGNGDVEATLIQTTLNGNGFYNEEDLDDGFDIDEADAGDIDLVMIRVSANDNKDEGLDFDEAGEGSVDIRARKVLALNNNDEGLKVDEEDAGDIEANLFKVTVDHSGDDGIQFTELGEGDIEAKLKKVTATNNKKYGIKIEQWVVEDEDENAEEAGSLKTKKVTLSGNGKGDDIKLNNIDY